MSNICLYITCMVDTLHQQLSPHSVSPHILYAQQAFGSIHYPYILCSGQKFSHRKLCRISSRPFKLHITEYICSIIYVLLDVLQQDKGRKLATTHNTSTHKSFNKAAAAITTLTPLRNFSLFRRSFPSSVGILSPLDLLGCSVLHG